MDQDLWVETFRFSDPSKGIFPNRIARFINGVVANATPNEKGEVVAHVPHLFAYSSSAGTGKTTTLKAIAGFLGYELHYFNVSEVGNIEVLREDVRGIAQTKVIGGKPKIIMLDEVDGASATFQKGLRGFIEEFADSVRFFLTANNINQVHPAVVSRMKQGALDFSFKNSTEKETLKKRMTQRIEGFLKKNSYEYEAGAVGAIVDRHFPDMRSCIGYTQLIWTTYGAVTLEGVDAVAVDPCILYGLICERDWKGARAWVAQSGMDLERIYDMIFEDFCLQMPESVRGEALLLTEEYIDRHSRSFLQNATFGAFLLRMISIVPNDWTYTKDYANG